MVEGDAPQKWVTVPVPMEVSMKKYGLYFITFFVAGYIMLVVFGVGKLSQKVAMFSSYL